MLIVFRVSPRARRILCTTHIILSLVRASLGMYVFIAASNVLVNISSRLHSIDRTRVELVFYPITFLGCSMVLVNVVGVKICTNCTSPEVRQHCGRDVIIWSCTSILLAFLQIIMCVAASPCTSDISNQLQNSLHNGILNYLSDPEWKQVFDNLHQELCCCGANGYSDWYRTPWISVNFLRESSHTVLRYMRVDGRALPPVLPWSCCNPRSLTPCLHDPLQQQRSLSVWHENPHVTIGTVFDTGCLKLILPPISGLLSALPIILGFNIALQFVSEILLRYIYTSARNSILIGDPGATTCGWIFGRGDCNLYLCPNLLETEKVKTKKHMSDPGHTQDDQ